MIFLNKRQNGFSRTKVHPTPLIFDIHWWKSSSVNYANVEKRFHSFLSRSAAPWCRFLDEDTQKIRHFVVDWVSRFQQSYFFCQVLKVKNGVWKVSSSLGWKDPETFVITHTGKFKWIWNVVFCRQFYSMNKIEKTEFPVFS